MVHSYDSSYSKKVRTLFFIFCFSTCLLMSSPKGGNYFRQFPPFSDLLLGRAETSFRLLISALKRPVFEVFFEKYFFTFSFLDIFQKKIIKKIVSKKKQVYLLDWVIFFMRAFLGHFTLGRSLFVCIHKTIQSSCNTLCRSFIH